MVVISVVIPVLNEERALPRTLQALSGQQGIHEVIVVDGGSTDDSVKILRSREHQLPRLKVLSTERGRGVQMNAGAAVATGDWLFFLHADSELPKGGLALLAQSGVQQDLSAGCFRHRFSLSLHTKNRTIKNGLLRFISLLHNWRFHRTGVIYGDQGMFVRRDLFNSLGGFPEEIMEDVLFSEKLLQHCQPVMLSATLMSDSRKFVQMGVLRALMYVLIIQLRHELKKPVSQPIFFHDYR